MRAQSRFLSGGPQQVAALWKGPLGPVILALALASAGAGVFWWFRGRLRQGRWLPWLLLGVIILLILGRQSKRLAPYLLWLHSDYLRTLRSVVQRKPSAAPSIIPSPTGNASHP
jgi:hypothetical protein